MGKFENYAIDGRGWQRNLANITKNASYVNTQAHNIMLTNNGTVSEHGAVPQARVVADCPHPAQSDCFYKVCLCFTNREARLLSTDHCSLITRHLLITDLSQSPQGAGGVGGLLCTSFSPYNNDDYYPLYDGNGNITEYIYNNCFVAAHYDYDPFGNTVATAGPISPFFDYRFSTKPRDIDTGLYYYGYRWYDPLTGRWTNRDPIGERGGVNLYGFLGNDSLNFQDYLGFVTIPLPSTGDDFSRGTEGPWIAKLPVIEYYDPRLRDATQRANNSLKDGLDCGCYKLTANFTSYKNKFEIEKRGDHSNPTFGMNSFLTLSATKNVSNNCLCECDAVKVVQIVTTTLFVSKNMGDQANSLGRRSRTRKADPAPDQTAYGSWRIDAVKGDDGVPFVSDTGFGGASGLTGFVNDSPGGYKYQSSFTARTCLICSKGKERGRTLGCVQWGYTSKTISALQIEVSIMKPTLMCGNWGYPVSNPINAAYEGWDDHLSEHERKTKGLKKQL